MLQEEGLSKKALVEQGQGLCRRESEEEHHMKGQNKTGLVGLEMGLKGQGWVVPCQDYRKALEVQVPELSRQVWGVEHHNWVSPEQEQELSAL